MMFHFFGALIEAGLFRTYASKFIMLDNREGYYLYVLDGSYGSKGIDVCQLVCCISLCVICHFYGSRIHRERVFFLWRLLVRTVCSC